MNLAPLWNLTETVKLELNYVCSRTCFCLPVVLDDDVGLATLGQDAVSAEQVEKFSQSGFNIRNLGLYLHVFAEDNL